MISSDEGQLETNSILNPYYQHMYHCLAHRAIKPGQVLPEVAPELKALMNPPEEVLAKSEEILKKIDSIFPRQEVGVKKEKVTAEKMFADKKR